MASSGNGNNNGHNASSERQEVPALVSGALEAGLSAAPGHSLALAATTTETCGEARPWSNQAAATNDPEHTDDTESSTSSDEELPAQPPVPAERPSDEARARARARGLSALEFLKSRGLVGPDVTLAPDEWEERAPRGGRGRSRGARGARGGGRGGVGRGGGGRGGGGRGGGDGTGTDSNVHRNGRRSARVAETGATLALSNICNRATLVTFVGRAGRIACDLEAASGRRRQQPQVLRFGFSRSPSPAGSRRAAPPDEPDPAHMLPGPAAAAAAAAVAAPDSEADRSMPDQMGQVQERSETGIPCDECTEDQLCPRCEEEDDCGMYTPLERRRRPTQSSGEDDYDDDYDDDDE